VECSLTISCNSDTDQVHALSLCESAFVRDVKYKTKSPFSPLLLAAIQSSENLRGILESNAAIEPQRQPTLPLVKLPPAKQLGRSLMSKLNPSDEVQRLVSEQQVDHDIYSSVPANLPAHPEIELTEILSLENPAARVSALAPRVVLS
jgi:hypothetical protein